MYSLDINFLKDRQPLQDERVKPKPTPINEKIPLFAGIAVGVLLPLGVAGFWLLQQSEQSKLTAEIENIDKQLTSYTQQQGELGGIEKETNAYKQQTQALASVFDQLKPWSILIKDVSYRVPAGVQISCISQIPVSTSSSSSSGGCQNVPNPPSSSSSSSPSPSPGATSVPTDKVEITGIALSFNSVNDLLLVLQKSLFFKDNETRLVTAQLIENPIKLERDTSNSSGSGDNFQMPQLQKVVQFKIQTSLSEKTASQLLPQLNSLGDIGLTSRIETLKQKGVLK